MKKIFSTILLCIAVTAMSAAKHVVPVTAVDAQGEKGSTKYNINYIYNSDNKLVWELIEASTRKEYTYNDKGLVSRITPYNWVEYTKSFKVGNIQDFEYDENGLVSKMTETMPNGDQNIYTYTKYEGTIAIEYSMLEKKKESGKEYKYDYKVKIDRDDQGREIKLWIEELDYDYLKDGFCGIRTEEYTYADNTTLLPATKTTLKYDYTFEKPKNSSKSVITYTYAEVKSEYAPKNLKAESDSEGKVTLTWDAVEGVTEYVVSYDLEHVKVTGTTYSVTLATGERKFTVQSIIDDLERNGADPVEASIVDPGKLPVTDLAVGTMTRTEEETESEEAPIRVFYNIPLTWTLPEGHSEIKDIKVYYNSSVYGEDVPESVGSSTATSYTLKKDPYEFAEWDEHGVPYKGINTPIYVKIVYVTGESEKSNVIYVNPWDEFETGIEAVSAAPAHLSNKIYTIDGKIAKTNMKGIVIMNGKKIRK